MILNLKRSLALSALPVLLLHGIAVTQAQPPTAGEAPAPVRAQVGAGRVYILTGGGDLYSPSPDRVAALVAEGKSLDEVIAARPTEQFDAIWGVPDHRLFLPALYAELAE